MDSVVAAVMSALEHLRLALQGVPGLAAVTSAPYMFRPFIMLMFLGIAAGLVGVIVNLRCLEFNAEAMVHSVFPGIVAGALYWGIDNIVPGAAVVAVIVAVALTWLGRSRRINEAGTAIVLTSFFGFGVVLSLYKGDMSGQLEALMFGRLLEVSDARLVQSILVCLIALVAIGVSWRAQVFRAFDRDGAMASGMSATAVDFLANAAIAAVVVASSSAVGVLLVIGYLVVPGAAARLVTHRISTMVPVAILVGVVGGWFGMWLMTVDSPHPISPQAAVALSVLALYALLLPVGYVMRKRGTGA
ncbi:zinc ABC transporter permease [Lawsonella clevelandensis]|uniref:Manganese transport system membrane protein MntB n=2 Tax=Lawsonella clevelandensis TaxID=1528099 RepID=A0A5E3ZWL8_9ACTN|nr:zinc ABC transporter permease [Lawsonella clevelandensis]VHO00411.1 Manganese transport system membrane protein MntB [Lawsonella clevelandensis]